MRSHHLHDNVDITGCPSWCGIAAEIEMARARLQADAIPLDEWGSTNTPEEELLRLEALGAIMEPPDLIFTHGLWLTGATLASRTVGEIW
jgi:hypothetical protein